MKKLIPFAFGPAVLMIYTMLSSSLLSGVLPQETMIVPLEGGENGVYTATFFHIPLFISGVDVDVSVKANTYLQIWCEFRIGEHCFIFTLNDMSLSFHIEQDRLEVDGKVSDEGIASFRAVIDTDGIIEGIPKLVISYYSL